MRSINPHPKKLFASATATSLSPVSRGNVKVPFSTSIVRLVMALQ